MKRLWMTLPALDNLPPAELPEGFSVHGGEGETDAAMEWILGGLAGSIGLIGGAPRAFFAREYIQDAAVALALIDEHRRGLLLGPFAHPWHDDRHAGRLAALHALNWLREGGATSVKADASLLCAGAVADCLALGFAPGEGAEWVDLLARAKEAEAKKMRIIPLWPGEAPYTAACGGQAQPSVKAFPVEGSRGAVVVCPGGGYQMKASHEGDPIARMLNDAGISAYVLDYRVMPCPFEAPLADASRAIRLVRSMGYEKVGILGFSAGGHLTCSAATLYTDGDPDSADPAERLSSRPDAFVPCYAVVSFASFRHQGSLKSLLGDQADDISLIRRFSAELHVDGDTPPAFIWHTANDPVVPVENSVNLAAALAHAGVPFELHVYPDGPHGLGLAGGRKPADTWGPLCGQFLLNLGFGRR